tara:strand:- start:2300 stop:2896 length:597 start_codon:yes stop_codon:yes gene_type:complete
MKIPKNYNEKEVIDIIESISTKLASKFKFGYHDIEDMRQQAMLFACEGLENYDGIRPLENFLWVHVKNRLYNFKRNNYSRPNKPCENCPFNAYIDKQCTKYKNMNDCDPYFKWNQRNEKKKNLMTTYEYLDINYSEATKPEDDIFKSHIYSIIDKNIPIHMREDWIRFINKAKLNKNKKEALLQQIILIIKEHNIDEP